MSDCLFCKIANKEIDSQIVHETDNTIAFKDINPAAPTHVLVIPKEHVASVQELNSSHAALLGEMFEAIGTVASEAGIAEGYRVVSNIGPEAGQSVFHLHIHVLGGRGWSWPPG
jgi:histidine triad (HIT) family protein